MTFNIQDLNKVDDDNTQNWPEGTQKVKEVNNAGRADEGMLARWFADWNGSKITAGTATAYTITSDTVPTAYYDGFLLVAEIHVENTGAATLNADSLGAVNIVKNGGEALEAGDLPAGHIAIFVYRGTDFNLIAPANTGKTGSLVFLAAIDLSSTSTANFTEFDSTKYNAYEFKLSNVVPSVDGDQLVVRTSSNGGANYDATLGDYIWTFQSGTTAGGGYSQSNQSSASRVSISGAVGSGSDGYSGTLRLYRPDLARKTNMTFEGMHGTTGADSAHVTGGGVRTASDVVNAVRFLFSSGTLLTGTIAFYGLRNL